MATRHEDTYTVTRITRHIPKPFDKVLAKLQSSIKQSDTSGLSILKPDNTKENFEKATSARLGPHGFMQFAQIDHGVWMPLYGVHTGKKSLRIVFGNPFFAITMLKHDVNAGLFVPVEALLVERPDGKGTDVIQIKPSSLIAGGSESRELKEAAEVLDGKVEALWDWVAADDS